MRPRINALLVIPMLVATALPVGAAGHAASPAEPTASVIVQAADAASAARLVGAVGGIVTHELGIIRAVGARLTAAQRDRLAGFQDVLHLHDDGRLEVDSFGSEANEWFVADEFETVSFGSGTASIITWVDQQ
jgi:hypothetical protein